MSGEKTALRARMRRLREAVTQSQRTDAALQIAQAVMALPCMRPGAVVLSYLPIRGEVDTGPLHEQIWREQMTLALPVVSGEQMHARRYDPGQALVSGAFGVPQPQGGAFVAAGEIDIALIPGVAFSVACDRLGYGKGYFDRYITVLRTDCMLLGLAYTFQVLDTIPTDPWDRALDGIVTPQQVMIKR